MEPNDDPQLRKLLREWRIEDAPASLDIRVLGARRASWRALLLGTLRVPVPVAVAFAVILILMGAALVRERGTIQSSRKSTGVNLANFRPADEMRVRIIAERP